MKPKQKSPREIIESERKPDYEHAYVKFPGQKMIPITLKTGKIGGLIPFVTYNPDVIKKLYEKNKKRYMGVHTHPSRYEMGFPLNFPGSVLPSSKELIDFSENKMSKTMVIAHQDPKTGKLSGYLFIRKPKGYKYLNKKDDGIKKLNSNSSQTLWPSRIEREYGLKTRFVPTEGYKVAKNPLFGVRFKKRWKRGLELKLVITLVLFSVSIFFLQSNLTGFTISNLTQKTSNIIGIILFIIGLIGIFYYLRRNPK